MDLDFETRMIFRFSLRLGFHGPNFDMVNDLVEWNQFNEWSGPTYELNMDYAC